MHDSERTQPPAVETCDYCGVDLSPALPGALFERRFCNAEHKDAYWTEARKVGDAALRTVKAIRANREAA